MPVISFGSSEGGRFAPRVVIVLPCRDLEHPPEVAEMEYFFRSHPWVAFVLLGPDPERPNDCLSGIAERFPAQTRLLATPGGATAAEAVRMGLLAALEHGPDYIGHWDAELTTPLEAITELFDVLEGNRVLAMATGARVRLLGRDIERRALRHYLGRVFATAASVAIGLPIYDTQARATLLRATPELGALLEEPFIGSDLFDVELLARLVRLRADSIEVPAELAIHELPLPRWIEARHGAPGVMASLRAAVDLWRIRRRYIASDAWAARADRALREAVRQGAERRARGAPADAGHRSAIGTGAAPRFPRPRA